MTEFTAAREIVHRRVDDLIPYVNNARIHPDRQIDQLARSISRYGFLVPVVVDGNGGILSGHGRIRAAKKIGIETVPTVIADHLTEDQRREYILADNRIAENAEWDMELLRIELSDLSDIDVDFSDLGFDDKELRKIMREPEEAEDDDGDTEPRIDPDDDSVREYVTQPGDIWILGQHRLMCGDSTSIDQIALLFHNTGGGG